MKAPAGVRTELTVPTPAGLPLFLLQARERLARLIPFPLRFLELHGAELLRPAERRRMEPRRMARREAINLVGASMLGHTDLVSLRVGSPRADGSVNPPGQLALAAETGLSLTRLRRAIRDGVTAGYWTRTQPRLKYITADGEAAWSSYRVIYRFTDRFFHRLGLAKRLTRERQRAAERCGQRRRIYALALLEARARFRKVRGAPRQAAQSTDAAENEARLMAELRLRLRARWPDWPVERIDGEAARLRRLM